MKNEKKQFKSYQSNMNENVIAYRFSDGTDFWAPYPDIHHGISLSNFHKLNTPKTIFLEGVTTIEEYIHRRLTIATKTRFEMSWEEALSLCELSSLLQEVNDYRAQLLIPIEYNLNKHNISKTIKYKIKNLKKADKLLKLYIKATEPFIESTTLIYVERLFGEINGPLFKKRLKKQLVNYPFLQKIYPLAKKAMNNYSIEIPLSSIILSPKTPNNSPPLSLRASFETFDRANATETKHRFDKLFYKLAKESISSKEELTHLIADLRFDYLKIDDIFDGLIPSYQAAIKELSHDFNGYFFSPINTPITLAMEKLERFEKAKEEVLSEMGKKREEMESGIFLADILYTGTSSVQLLENLDHTTKTLETHPTMNAQMAQEVIQATIMMFFLRRFVLNGVLKCPVSGNFEECESCLLIDPMKPKFLNRIDTGTICPAFRILKETNIKVVRS